MRIGDVRSLEIYVLKQPVALRLFSHIRQGMMESNTEQHQRGEQEQTHDEEVAGEADEQGHGEQQTQRREEPENSSDTEENHGTISNNDAHNVEDVVIPQEAVQIQTNRDNLGSRLRRLHYYRGGFSTSIFDDLFSDPYDKSSCCEFACCGNRYALTGEMPLPLILRLFLYVSIPSALVFFKSHASGSSAVVVVVALAALLVLLAWSANRRTSSQGTS